jgi:hypothetical protein
MGFLVKLLAGGGSMRSRRISLITLICVLAVGLSACNFLTGSEKFSTSGTIILSRELPAIAESQIAGTEGFAPLLGYVPPSSGFLPAQNETWLKLDREHTTITVFRGNAKIKEIRGEGSVTLPPGTYALQYKQKEPSWYAPDDYFVKRHLAIPAPSDPLRYRRGALGEYALFPTTSFAIHSGPIWTEDVGGLRVSRGDLSAIYYMIPLGASVKVE